MFWRDGIVSAWRLGGALLLLLALSSPAFAQAPLRGVALVIGNSTYEHLTPLANPVNDARAVEALLDDLGFETSLSSDRDARRLARDLRDFVDDAEGADVAVLFYAGHGIEAGGENWLVPVDADLSALDAAGERLVPISDIVARLQQTVAVTILLLDACRDNPFPPGALVRVEAGAEPVPVGEGGLAETRGARAMQTPAPAAAESLGTVIAFAAEPGHVALDGPPGAHSPYTQALLRHFDAMAGAEFGLVMRMIGEEVYLKTAGAQRPWVNESLRRLLYLGTAPEPAEGAEGEILAERRSLLVTIADLPDINRLQVERVAASASVPMDALFAVLRSLGQEAPTDPGRLDELLRDQGERLAEIMAERTAITATDPELVRLASLAATALDEGALEASLRLHDAAKARVQELSATIDDVEEELRRRRLEFAAVFADSAAARELTFDYAAAADDYDEAYEQVARWDDALAWNYRRRGVVARYRHGEYRGEAGALERLLAGSAELLRLAGRQEDPLARGEALLQVGNVRNILGRQASDSGLIEAAIADYQAALAIFEAGGDAHGSARARNNLAHALTTLGNNEPGPERLEEAIALYEALAAEAPFEASSAEWMIARLNLASAISRLGERSADTAVMRRSMDILAEIVERVAPEEDPIPWASSQFNLAGTMLFIGEREGNPRMLADSVIAGQRVLEIWTREAFPLNWASVHNNIGNAYQVLGVNLPDANFLKAAEYEYRDALEEWRRDRVPGDWAMATNNLANVLKKLGDLEDDEARLAEAIAAYHACMEVWTRAEMPLSWASAQNNLGDGLAILGALREDAAMLAQAVEAFDAALSEWTVERVPYDWSVATNNRGGALVQLGSLTADAATIREGIADIEAAWAFDRGLGETGYDAYYEERLADARARLAAVGG